MNNALLIAKLTLQEALRKKWVAVLLILTTLFIGFYLYGIFKLEITLAERAVEAGIEQRAVNGLSNLPVMYSAMFGMYLVFFLSSLMSVLSTVSAISSDIENGVMQSIIARPVGRSGLVFGRWLGFAAVNVGYVLLLSFTLLGGVFVITGYLPPASLEAVGLVVLSVVLLTSFTILGSTLFSTLANGIGVFVLYGVGFTGGILKTIAQTSDTATLNTLGQVANTVMPTNALWLGASYYLQPEILLRMARIGGESGMVSNPFFSTVPIEPNLIIWAVALAVLALLGAMWRFNQRDL